MVQNPKNEGHCMAVMTRSGKSIIDTHMLVIMDEVIDKGLGGEVKVEGEDLKGIGMQ
ncbi:MAG: hypothetical protein Q8830_02990 [Candidatus Phytoplasma australasiaticum]|nr:hypothetical protein [Candidatus Phytoplasma australasiaticum]